MSSTFRLLDVSVPLVRDMPTYPGNPEFELQAVKRMAAGASSNVSRIVTGAHAGTHVDAPFHFFDDGVGVDGLPLELMIGRARVLECPRPGGIAKDYLAQMGLRGEVRVLLKTPNSAFWSSSEFRQDYAHLTRDGAEYLVEIGVKVVGIDYLSIEQFKAAGAPAHRALLSAGVVIIEGLNLSDAKAGHYDMYCLPLRVAGADGAPARVVLKIE